MFSNWQKNEKGVRFNRHTKSRPSVLPRKVERIFETSVASESTNNNNKAILISNGFARVFYRRLLLFVGII